MPQSVIPELEASISPVNMLQVQILGHYPRPTESETVGAGGRAQKPVSASLPGDSGAPSV